MFSGELADGLALAAQASAEAEELDLYPLSAQALGLLAMARAYSGDFEGERRAHEAKLAVVRANGDLARTADVLNTLAEIALDDGDADTARAFAVEALGVAGQRLPTVVRDASITLARAALAQGDLVEAGRRLAEALDQSDRLGQTFAVAQCLRVGGGVAAARGEADTAVRLFAAAQSLSASPGGGDVPPDQDLAAALTEARASLSEQAARTAWTLGVRPPARERAGPAGRRARPGQRGALRASVAACRSLVHSAPNRSRPDGSAAHSKEAGVAGSGSKLSRTSGRSGSAPLFSSRK